MMIKCPMWNGQNAAVQKWDSVTTYPGETLIYGGIFANYRSILRIFYLFVELTIYSISFPNFFSKMVHEKQIHSMK